VNDEALAHWRAVAPKKVYYYIYYIIYNNIYYIIYIYIRDYKYTKKQDKQCRYNVTMNGVQITIVVMENQ